MLIFTIINSVLNFEADVTRNLTNSYQMVTVLQSISDVSFRLNLLATTYTRSPSVEIAESIKQSYAQLADRADSLEHASSLFTGLNPVERSNLANQINYLKIDLSQYFGRVESLTGVSAPKNGLSFRQKSTEADVAQAYQLIHSDSVQIRSGLESSIIEHQGILLASLSRRTALLGLQALVVIISLIAIGFGYIAPAFQRVLHRLAKQNVELRDLDRTKMEFLSIASHQLKTPLSGLKWNLSLLYRLRHSLSERDRKYLTQSKEHTDSMIRLVSNFLNVSRIEQGRMDFDIQPTDVVPIIKAILRTNARLASMRKVEVKLGTDRPKVIARIDPLLFRQVIQNLVDNAILYNHPGGLVDVQVRHMSEKVVIQVADTGSGISQAEQSRLFSQFFRGENAKTMRPDGSGLGLYCVKKIIQKMAGSITGQSKLNVGTTFTVSVPRSRT